jgi:hypothetical protein
MKKLLINMTVLLFILTLAFSGIGQAAQNIILKVSTPTGSSGETVKVVVTLSNLKSMEGVKGISGGEFVLTFDPDMVKVDQIEQGDIIGQGFFFLANDDYSKNSLKVVFASSTKLIQEEGILCQVTFSLKKEGSVRAAINNPIIYDQDLGLLNVALGEDESGTEDNTVKEPKETGDTAKPKDNTTPGTPPSGGNAAQPNEPASGGNSSVPQEGSTEGTGSDQQGGTTIEEGNAGEDQTAAPSNGTDETQRSWLLPLLIIIGLAIVGSTGYYIYKQPGRAW